MKSIGKGVVLAVAITSAFIGLRAWAIGTDQFPASWFWHSNEQQWQKHAPLLGKSAPTLEVTDWIGRPVTGDVLKGKIVVIDFWATWCGPCRAALPHNNDLVDKYGDQGVVVVAVCTSQGQEKMKEVLTPMKPKFYAGRDAKLTSEKAWRVMWYPTYALVDRQGKVRAIGLKSNKVEDAVKKLLEEQPGEGGTGEASDAPAKPADEAAWEEGSPTRRAMLAKIEGKAPPELEVENWTNGQAVKLSDLKGKVVMLDFWATWCGPCLASVPHTNKLNEKYKDQGLVVIGVCNSRGGEKMAETVKSKSIAYTVAVDISSKTTRAYRVDSFPDYYFIDRSGKLRAADCRNADVEKVIEKLLAEKAE